MVSSILCVCTGNICRSPVCEAVLRAALPGRHVSSAGLYALVGHGIDADSAAAAHQRNIMLGEHVARQFTTRLGEKADLILVMDRDHRDEITGRWPHLSGKTMPLGHFENRKDIPDPYRRGAEMHQHVVDMILDSVTQWVPHLDAMHQSKTPQ